MSIKLSNTDKKLLKKIDKSSKWEDIKSIKDIDEEIQKLEIYEDFIGLGCSRYLNEAGDTGKLDIDEMFRNCREAEKVRIRVKKKETKEERKAGGKRGRGGGGNIGALTNQQTKKDVEDIPSKQNKSNPIVNKAIQIKDSLKDILSKSLSGDGWKGEILKLGLSLGMDTLFGIVLGVMDMSEYSPTGAVFISAIAMDLIYEIYNYISETQTGKKLLGKAKDLLNELYDYLMGNDIKVIKKDKKKKKKPPPRGGGSKKDDDDDEDDDDKGGDTFTLDKDELDTYTTEETKEDTKKQEQDLSKEPEQPKGTINNLEQVLPILLQQYSAQSQQNSMRDNDIRMTTQEARNPTQAVRTTVKETKTTPTGTETTTKETIQEQIEPQNNQPTDQQNTQPDSSLFPSTGLGILGGLYAGYNYFSNSFMNAGNPANYNQVPLGQPLSGEAGSGIGGTGQEVLDSFSYDNTLSVPAPTTDPVNLVRTDNPIGQQQQGLTPQEEEIMKNSQDLIQQQQDTIKKQGEVNEELNRKVNDYIDNMDKSGQAKALGLFRSSFGVGKSAMTIPVKPVLKLRGGPVERSSTPLVLKLKETPVSLTRTDTTLSSKPVSLTEQEDIEEQLSLLQDIEIQANLIKQKVIANEEDRKMSPEEYAKYVREQQDKLQEQQLKNEDTINKKQKEFELEQEQSRIKQEQMKIKEQQLKTQMEEQELKEAQERDRIFQINRNRIITRQRGQTLEALQSNLLSNVRDTVEQQNQETLENLSNTIVPRVRERVFNQFEKDTILTINQMVGRGRRPSQNRMILYRYLGRPYRRGINPITGSAYQNDVLFSEFQGQALNRFPENTRQSLNELMERFKRTKNLKTTSKLEENEISEIINILRKSGDIE